MADYKIELVKKVVRMLESNHDGEAAAAARRLTAMAMEQGHNVDEMLKAVYGGAGPKYRAPSEDDPPWNNDFADAQAWAKQAWTHRAATGTPKLSKLNDLIELYGTSRLTSWEQEFVTDILDRDLHSLSERQEAVVDRIIDKLERYAQRNGPQDFWGA